MTGTTSSVLVTVYPTRTAWQVTYTHPECLSCATAASKAVAIARATGSPTGSHTDGDHAATAEQYDTTTGQDK